MSLVRVQCVLVVRGGVAIVPAVPLIVNVGHERFDGFSATSGSVPMKRLLTALVSVNACAWPGVFAAYAIWSGDHYRIVGYVGAGAVFGGIVLLFMAMLLVFLASWFPDRWFAKSILDASLSARNLAIGRSSPLPLGWPCWLASTFDTNQALNGLAEAASN